jgi:hypothetical protein
MLTFSHNQSLHEEASRLMHSHLRPYVAKLLKELEELEPDGSILSGWQDTHDEAERAIEFEEQYSKIFSTE